jgi:hypothetical protein
VAEGSQAVHSVSPVACPECGRVLPAERLDAHLRGAHRLYQFRGSRAPLADTLPALLDALCRTDPDPEAYAVLERIARAEYRRGAGPFLASALGPALGRVAPRRLSAVCAALAGAIAARPSARAVALFLAADGGAAGRRLALALGARLPAPLERRVVRALRPLLGDRHLPAEAQIAAAAALLRTTGDDGPRAKRLLRALVAGRSKVKAVDRLRRLEARVGPAPAVQALRRHLEDRIRMRCPRCHVQMRRPAMIEHLWAEHGLLLQGERVREPWPLIEEWLDAAGPGGDAEVVKRCRALAEQIDPREGTRRLQRLLLARGVEDAEARRALLAEAAEQRASLCPRCYALVPVPRDEPPRPMSVSRGRLSVNGYRVEVSEAGFVPHVEFETPAGLRRRERLPGRRLTRRAAVLLLAGPPVLLALALALVNLGIGPLPPVAGLLLLALLLALGVRLFWRPGPPPDGLAVDHAWGRLAPRLHAEGFSLEDSAFLASLALASLSRGRPEARREALGRLLRLTERVVGAGFGGAHALAALRRLAVADAARAGKDRVLLTVAEVDSCFHGKLPLAYAEGLLEGRREDGWSRGERARLRVLLCDSAFDAGFEVADLLEAGAAAPALEAVLGGDPDGLARLRLLWSLRATRPWDRHGEADTAFDLAGDAAWQDLLGRYPDLLLRHPLPPRFAEAPGGPAHLLLCGRGVVFHGTVLTRPPRVVEVTERRSGRGGYELVVDDHRFPFDSNPDAAAARLERWCRYHFEEFVPLVADVHRWPSPDATAILRAWGAVRCPDCRRSLLPRPGEVGVSLEQGGGAPRSPAGRGVTGP